MQDNMLLIKEINMQRGHNKAAKRVLEAQVMRLRAYNKSTYTVVDNPYVDFEYPLCRLPSRSIN